MCPTEEHVMGTDAVAALVGFVVGFVTAGGLSLMLFQGPYWTHGRRLGFSPSYLIWWRLFRR
jgi:hypothetical protein